MKEIKFRAWVKRDEDICPVYSIDFRDRDMFVRGCGREKCDLCTELWSFDEVELMQYTGLKDKNGKEIFEGDIVKVGTLENEPVGPIEWDDMLAEYVVTDEKLQFGGENLTEMHAQFFEVIGNIYENPELLEVL